MPAFNASATIADSINSVISQSHTNWELLIINDASTDETLSISHSFAEKDPRVKIFSQNQNQGVAKSRNLALEVRSGRYVCFLDSDDIWLANKLECQLFGIKPEYVFSYMAYSRMDSKKNLLRTIIPPKEISYENLLRGNQIGTLTVMLNSDFLAQKKFPIRGHEDYALWLSLLRNGSVATRSGGDYPYALYRVHESSLSSSKIRAAGWQWKIYREQEKLSILSSSFLMPQYLCRALLKRFLPKL
jgi:hypothetical protein